MTWSARELRLTVNQFRELDAMDELSGPNGFTRMGASLYSSEPLRSMVRRGLVRHNWKRNMATGLLKGWITKKGREALFQARLKPVFMQKVNEREARDQALMEAE